MERKTSKGEKYRVKLKKSLILRKFKAVYICRMCVNKLSLMYLNTNTCEGQLCLGICYFRPIKRNLKKIALGFNNYAEQKPAKNEREGGGANYG